MGKDLWFLFGGIYLHDRDREGRFMVSPWIYLDREVYGFPLSLYNSWVLWFPLEFILNLIKNQVPTMFEYLCFQNIESSPNHCFQNKESISYYVCVSLLLFICLLHAVKNFCVDDWTFFIRSMHFATVFNSYFTFTITIDAGVK